MKTPDKVTITIELERNVNNTISRKTTVEGEGFHFYEIIGMLQISCYEFSQQSLIAAKEIPKDKPVRLSS